MRAIQTPGQPIRPCRPIWRIFVFAVVVLILASAQTAAPSDENYVRIPVPPPFTPALQADGSPHLITLAQLENDFKKHSQNLKQLIYNPDVQSTEIIVPDAAWLEELRKSFKKLIRSVGIKPEADTWDCENYSSLLSALTTLKLWEMGYHDSRAALGHLRVNAKKSWAGIPAGMHSLIFTYTIEGIYIVEPQNGEAVKIEDYPNRQYIEEVYLF